VCGTNLDCTADFVRSDVLYLCEIVDKGSDWGGVREIAHCVDEDRGRFDRVHIGIQGRCMMQNGILVPVFLILQANGDRVC
jgi:hypothetical protein